MTTEHEMAIEIAKEIGKQVPVKAVYEDAASPAVKQVGTTLEDIVKCVRLVGFPIQWMAVQHDRFSAFLERSKERVPEENRVLPAPQILGPILEGIRYGVHDSLIVAMFESLLSSAMDKDRLHSAHPSYPSIIKQLTSDEALVLVRLLDGDLDGEVVRSSGRDPEFIPDCSSVPDGMEAANMDLAIDHLTSLGLVFTEESSKLSGRRSFEGGYADKATVYLQPIGRRFIKACRPSS